MMEEWRDVVGYEGIYEVSNMGNVRTKEGKTTWQHYSGTRVWKQRILTQMKDNRNACSVNLWKDRKNKGFLVHRLVAIAFIPNPNNYPIINHKDCNPSNNNVDNIEWCDNTYNINHAYDNGLMKETNLELIRLKDEERIWFRSFKKANEFLGRSKYHIQYQIYKRKIYFVDGYYVNVLNNVKCKP